MKTILLSIFLSTSIYAGEFKVLSWNIYSLPSLLNIGKVKERAPLIAQKIKSLDYDVVVLQEAFNLRTRKFLFKTLKEIYPYNTGHPKNKIISQYTDIFKINNGLMIFSKFPILKQEVIFYKNCSSFSADCLSNKGALMARIRVSKQKTIDVFNTHLQSGSKKAQIIKLKQLKEFRQFYENHKVSTIPQILAGDLNLDRYKKDQYQKIQQVITPKQTLLGTMKYSSDSCLNTLKKCSYPARRKLIDYILLPKAEKSLDFKKYEVKRFTYINKESEQSDLSDHFALSAVFQY